MVHGNIVSLSILIISVFIFFLSYRIVLSITTKNNLTNILFFFMCYYVVFAYIGSIIINVWYVSSGIGYKIYDRKDILLQVWLITSSGMVIIPLLVKLVFCTVKLKPTDINNFKQKSFSERRFSFTEECNLWFVFFFCLLVFTIYIHKIDGVPLIKFLQNRDLSAALLRSNATNNFQGKSYRYVLFYSSIPLILLIISTFNKQKIYFITLLIYNCFVAVMNFEKGPIVNLLIILVLIYLIKNKKVSFKFILLLVIIGVILLISMYILFMNVKNVNSLISGILNRIFTVQIIPFTWYFKYVEKTGFLYGTSFPNPAGFFPFINVRLSVEVMDLYFYSIGQVTNVVGSMPSVFMAEWYANFGYIGIILSFCLFSLLISISEIICITILKKKSCMYILSIYIFIIYKFALYSGTSFTGIVFDFDLILPICILYVLKIIQKDSCYIFKLNFFCRKKYNEIIT